MTDTTPLIPRDALYGNPERADVKISPDGRHLSWLAPRDGVLNVYVAPVGAPGEAVAVTADTSRGIRSHEWAYTNRHILFPQDVGGDENWHVYSIDLDTGRTLDLTPYEQVAATIVMTSREHPNEVLLGVNNRVAELHDLIRADIATGERHLVVENQGFVDFVAREDFTAPLAAAMTPDGGMVVYKDDGGAYEPFLQIPMEDTLTTHPFGFTKGGRTFYALDSRGRDTAAVVEIDLASGQSTLVFDSDVADVHAILTHPVEKTVQAVAVNHHRTEWFPLDDSVADDLRHLAEVDPGEPMITSRTDADDQWIVAYLSDAGPVHYYRYDRSARRCEYLFASRSDLDRYPLTPMHPLSITSRDGLELVSYLSLPPQSDPGLSGRPESPLPMVLAVHGGPWARDEWGFDPEHQLLANRGYAVLSVNYRGSTGFGKGFLNAGNKQWGARMHDDLLDAVDWAVAEGIARRDRVAIYGGSYGGYAALAGLTLTPEVFACGVDIVGPSNIATLLESIPAYWEPMVQMFKDRVGDFTTDDGREFLRSRSPLTYADRIQRPLLIGQGANDPRVKQAESEQIVSAMTDHGIPVTYVLFPDEGHGFAEPANRLSFFAVAEAFLARHLGGRAEPFGAVFEESSITVPSGVAGIPGLAPALTSD